MSIITLISAGGAPGVSTTAAALTSTWPGPVVAVDADPVAPSLLPGWLATTALDPNVGIPSFTVAVGSGGDLDLAAHTQPVPRLRHAQLLAGHPDPGPAVPGQVWRDLAAVARDHTIRIGADVLVDVGRWGSDTPWPVLVDADLVLLCVQPGPRGLAPAGAVVTSLRSLIPPQRLALAVLGAADRDADRTVTELATPVAMVLPGDRIAAREYSDATPAPRAQRGTRLRPAARAAARHLHSRLHTTESARTEVLR